MDSSTKSNLSPKEWGRHRERHHNKSQIITVNENIRLMQEADKKIPFLLILAETIGDFENIKSQDKPV